MLCMECGAHMRVTSEPIIEEYKGMRLTVTGIAHYACDACGEYELGPAAADELSRQLIEGYARARGLLTPTEIRDARKKLGMTQAEFERAVGVSTPTASRWETGAMSPSKSVCKLIRLLVERHEASSDAACARALLYAPDPAHRAAYLGWEIRPGGKARPRASHYDASAAVDADADFLEAKEG